jgi:small-conductance mechanosensitive channel
MEENANNVELDENGFIPGTSYKSVQDLIKGHGELKGKFDAQGNEIGRLKGQAQTLAETLKETLTRGKQQEPAEVAGPDYDKELMTAQAELKKLDPMSDDFTEKQADLIARITDAKTSKVKDTVLKTAGELFQKELKSRDAKMSQKQFLDENPTFNTPEMQSRIQDFLTKDKTGMHDNMSAYFALQRTDLLAEREAISKENEEMRKALNLQKGKDSTGKVIVKGQSPGQTTNFKKATGKDLDNGMMEALQRARDEV